MDFYGGKILFGWKCLLNELLKVFVDFKIFYNQLHGTIYMETPINSQN